MLSSDRGTINNDLDPKVPSNIHPNVLNYCNYCGGHTDEGILRHSIHSNKIWHIMPFTARTSPPFPIWGSREIPDLAITRRIIVIGLNIPIIKSVRIQTTRIIHSIRDVGIPRSGIRVNVQIQRIIQRVIIRVASIPFKFNIRVNIHRTVLRPQKHRRIRGIISSPTTLDYLNKYYKLI